MLGRGQLFATPQTIAYQPPPSTGFSQQEYWSGLHFPPPGDLPDPGTEPTSPSWQADSLPLSHGKPLEYFHSRAICVLVLKEEDGEGE